MPSPPATHPAPCPAPGKHPNSAPTNGAEVVAARLAEVARGLASGAAPPAPNAIARMRDTVVFGYLMASAKDARVDVPEW